MTQTKFKTTTLLLTPTDTLYFGDGRPMEGALSGHGAAWPLPHIVNTALHAALHRADIDGVHIHCAGRSGKIFSENRDKKFGSLKTAGPFPVETNAADGQHWFFPTPADLVKEKNNSNNVKIGYVPEKSQHPSSLPESLDYALAASGKPDKNNKPAQWMAADAWKNYLRGDVSISGSFKNDSDIFEAEHNTGIAIDAGTGATVSGKFYTAHYLRLRDNWRLGVLADGEDKGPNNAPEKMDLLAKLFTADGHIIIGGQQRVCTVSSSAAQLPRGLTEFQLADDGKYHVKWVLLSPAVFPKLDADSDKKVKGHPGGWLPNWIDADHGQVRLLDGPGKNFARRHHVAEGQPINARLVAALVGKPLTVTGWALPATQFDQEGRPRQAEGAKPAQFAVPAGAIYYFTADSERDARSLSAALNWHGAAADGEQIVNRRSTLLGEKGYGLGVCGTWKNL
jgi:CRISPR type III-B/RAMP module-associated protein Cmr3